MTVQKAVEALTRAMERKHWTEDGWEVPAIDVQEALDALSYQEEVVTYVDEGLTLEDILAEEEEHKRLLKKLESARNYSYEANMGDYSMASINSAKAQVDAAKQALIDAGYEVPTW